MRAIGFSTGALAMADFRGALERLHGQGIPVVELSALREQELEPLIAALDDLDLHEFQYVSVHAPSRLEQWDERMLIHRLTTVAARELPIIVHPDVIGDFSLWREFGPLLCIENMDKRKPIGRTVSELALVFDRLPAASFCLDIGHARQVDPTMSLCVEILAAFGPRLRQVHVSEVNASSKHEPLNRGAIHAFRKIAHMIPENIPVVLETPTEDLRSAVSDARAALPSAIAVVT
jgi:hypothetical protein